MLMERLKSEAFTKTGRKIADYILDNSSQVSHMTISEFAKGCGVSKASVVRFCQALGIKGFGEFKVALTREISSGSDYQFNIVQKRRVGEMSLSDVFYNTVSLDRQAVDQLTSTLDLKQVQKAIESINASKSLAVYGAGASAFVAEDLTHKLTKLRFQVRQDKDFHYMLSVILAMNPGSVLILISTTGETQEVLQLAQFAQEHNLVVIAITTLQRSSLVKNADIVLSTPVLEEIFRVGNMATRISQLAVVDILYMTLYETMGQKVIDEFYELRDAVQRFRR